MADSTELLRKLRGEKPRAEPPAEFDDEEEERGPCYGWLRGRRERVEMLELRFKSGRRLALDYHHLYSVEFEPGKGITFNFGEVLVRLHGRSLRHIAECAERHRLTWVEEVDPVRSLAAESEPEVIRITLHNAGDDNDSARQQSG